MADKIELYSTREGDDVTKKTDDMKKEAWQVLADLGISVKGKEGADTSKGVASLNYVPRGTGAFVMTIEGATPETVEAFKEGTAFHRTDAAKAAMSTELAAIRAEPKPEKAPVEKPEAAPKADKAPKEPLLPRTNIAIYPIAIEDAQVKEGQERPKAEASVMLAAAKAAIAEVGAPGVASSYDKVAGNWVVGGRGLEDATVKGLEERLSDYRTPEAESRWRANAPDMSAKSVAKGPAEGVDVAAAALVKGAGAER